MSYTDPRPSAAPVSGSSRRFAHRDDAKDRRDESTRVRGRRSPMLVAAGAALLVLITIGGVAIAVSQGGSSDGAQAPAAARESAAGGSSPDTAPASPESSAPTSLGAFTARGQVTSVALLALGGTGDRIPPTDMAMRVTCTDTTCRVSRVTGGGILQGVISSAFDKPLTGPPGGPWSSKSPPPASCDAAYPMVWRTVELAVRDTRVTWNAESYPAADSTSSGICRVNGGRLRFTGRIAGGAGG